MNLRIAPLPPSWPLLLLCSLALGSCDDPGSPTAAVPEADAGVTAQDPASAAAAGAPLPLVVAGRPVLPPGVREMSPGQAMRLELVGFPDPAEAGVCYTQVANPEWLVQAQRPAWLNREPRWGRGMDWLRLLGRWRQQDPFRLHRLEVEMPEEAWAEAQGRIAFFQYRLRDPEGHVYRVARCVVPASQKAVDHLSARFSRGRGSAGASLSPAGSSCSAGGSGVAGVAVAAAPGPARTGDDPCPPGRCRCEEGPFNAPAWGGEEGSPYRTEGSGDCACALYEGGCYPLIEIEGFVVSPECGFFSSWDPSAGGCECYFDDWVMDGSGDCFWDPDDPGGYDPPTYCDPCFEPDCEGDCGGGGGGGGNPPDPPGSGAGPELVVECTPSTVTRGSQVSCLARPGDPDYSLENLVWTFAGEGVSLEDLPSDNPLVGPLVTSGTLTAEATVNGVDGIMQSVLLSATPRQLDWQELSFKNERHSALMKDGGQDIPPATTAWLCSIDYQDCSSYGGLGQKWIWPDFQAVTPSGVTVSEIQGEGPNAGLWWFSSISYQVRSGWNMNDNYLPGAPTVILGDSIQRQQCITYGVSGPPVNVNWYGFNRVCKQTEALEGFETKARQHEQGHWDQLHSAAQNWPLYNPHVRLEFRVAQGSLGWSQLEDLVRTELPEANEGLHWAAVPEPPQVFSAHVWFLDQGSNPLRFSGPILWQW